MYNIIYFPSDYDFPDNVNSYNQEQLTKYYLDNKDSIHKSDQYIEVYGSIQDFVAAFSNEQISDLGAVCIVPKDYNNTEELIADTLPPIIEAAKQRMYTDDFKATAEYNTDKITLETFGAIISKYCRWDGDKIATVSRAAFEDSNFNPVEEARATLQEAGYVVSGLWSREDITNKAEEMKVSLTDEQVDSVFIKMSDFDPEYGINWQYIADLIREVIEESKIESHA